MATPLDGLRIMVATPCLGPIPLPTVYSYLETQKALLKYGVPLDICFFTGSLVHHARSLAAAHFLKGDYNRLFWIDSDIQWSAFDFAKIAKHSIRHECVVGIYPRRSDPMAFYAKFRAGAPTDEGLVEIEGTGLGFACIQREVIERLAEKAPKLGFGGKPPFPFIFRCDATEDGEARGEDYAFWADVSALGYKIWADATITLGHVGQKVYQLKLET